MISVELVDFMGGDISVVNAARVSFNKHTDKLEASDVKLIEFLAKNNHWTPFGHVSAQFRIKAPIFVARQLGKHQVGLVWNEISRRYVDEAPEFFEPINWRERNPDKKQGSFAHSFIEKLGIFSIKNVYSGYCKLAKFLYTKMIQYNVCPEQARMVLPQSMYTEWYWTGSLMAFARIAKLRLAADSQYETRIVGEYIDEAMKDLFPVSWKALMKPRHDNTENSNS